MCILKRLAGVILLLMVFFLSCTTGSGSRKEDVERKENVQRELHFGRLIANEIIKKFPLLINDKVTLYVNNVGKSVALFSGRSDIEYYFSVLDSDTINAYAAPGGYVFITKGALQKMKNESELAGVLAHEIGHINNRHIMKDLPPPRETKGVVDFIASLLVAQGTVVSSALNEVVGKAAELLFTKGYKIQDEYEADRSAIFYTDETGYNSRGLVDFLARIQTVKEGSSSTVVYNTHPPLKDRISRIEDLVQNNRINIVRGKVESRFNEELKNLK